MSTELKLAPEVVGASYRELNAPTHPNNLIRVNITSENMVSTGAISEDQAIALVKWDTFLVDGKPEQITPPPYVALYFVQQIDNEHYGITADTGDHRVVLSDNKRNNIIFQTFITDSHNYYVYRDQGFPVIGESVIPLIASVGREENLRFLEQMLGKSDHQLINQQIINSLGNIGNERTIDVLGKYNRYPDDVQKAVARIQKRLPAK